MEDAFCNYHGSVVYAQELSLDDGGKGEVHYLVQADGGLVEHLGNDGHGAMGCLADAECEMAGAAAHCAYDEPVAACAGILIDGLCKVGAFILCGIESEGGGVAGKRQVVVYGLGDVDVADGVLFCLQELGDAVGSGCRVVSAHGYEELDVVFLEKGEVEVFFKV